MLRKTIEKYQNMPVVARAAFWFMICSFLQKTMSVITTPIFTRLMSPTQYGQFTVYSSWLNIFTVIVTLRLDYSVFNKGMSKFKDGRDEYTSTMQYITTCLAVFLLLIYLLFKERINRLTELPTFIMLAMFAELVFSPSISFWTLRKRYEYIYRDVVLRTLLMAIMNAVLGILFVYYSQEKGYARIVSTIVVQLSFGIPIYYYNLKRGHFSFSPDYAKFALLFNLPLLAHFLSIYILEQFDRIMIQKMVGLEAAAFYGLTHQAGSLMKIFTVSLNGAIIPWMYGKLEKREYEFIDQIIFSVTLMVAFIAVVFSIVAPEAIRLFAGEKYYSAIYVVPPVALAMIFQFLYILYANIEFYYDLNKVTVFISSGAALLNIILNYIGIKTFGYIAAAYTTLICYILMSVGHFLYMSYGVKKSTGKRPEFKSGRMLFVSGLALLLGTLTVFLYPYPLLRYFFVMIAAVIAWIKRKQILAILSMVKKKA